MSLAPYRLTATLHELCLNPLERVKADSFRWDVSLKDDHQIIIELLEGGQFLQIRSSPLVQTQDGCMPLQSLMHQVLARNAELKIGCYAIEQNELVYRSTLICEDHEPSSEQLQRLIRTAIAEVFIFSESLGAVTHRKD